ncbi:MAG: DUF4230 domain-containing protein [Patescibacteria group bacterium]
MEKSLNKALAKGMKQITTKYAWLLVIIVGLLWITGNFWPSIVPDSLKEFIGVKRVSSQEVREIVAGELSSEALLSEATREYTGTSLVKKEGGILNCAGEEQLVDNGRATARAVVRADGISYEEKEDKVYITIPEAELTSVDLDENLEIVNKRNPCVRLVQVFGDVTSESEVRVLLKDEITEQAEQDTEIFKEAECTALSNLSTILNSSGVDSDQLVVGSASKELQCN